jgi:hypothetical protein
VRAGDLLLTLNAEGQPAFEPVLYLSHKLNNADAASMRSIEYASDALAAQPLVASHDHLIFVKKGEHTDLSMLSENLIPASEVKVRIQRTTHNKHKAQTRTDRHTADTQTHQAPSLCSPPRRCLCAFVRCMRLRLLFLSSSLCSLSLSLSVCSSGRLPRCVDLH